MLSRRILALAFIFAVTTPFARLSGQPAGITTIGSFAVVHHADSIDGTNLNSAMVWSSDGDVGLMWACNGTSSDVLAAKRRDAPEAFPGVARASFRFDQEAPDSTLLLKITDGRPHLVHAADSLGLGARAMRAQRMVLRVREASGEHDYSFDLTGGQRALAEIGCVSPERVPGPPSAFDRQIMLEHGLLTAPAPSGAAKPQGQASPRG